MVLKGGYKLIVMPQELHVLKCYSCETFQVQIVKKVPKWQCKACNVKQSLKKVYATGSGKDCRKYVQELNMKQGELAEASVQQERKDLNCGSCSDVTDGGKFSVAVYSGDSSEQSGSKWSQYLDCSEGEGDESTGSGDAYEECSSSSDILQDPQPTSKAKRRKNHCEGPQSLSRWSKYTVGQLPPNDNGHCDKHRNFESDLGSCWDQSERNHYFHTNPEKLQSGRQVSRNTDHKLGHLLDSNNWFKEEITSFSNSTIDHLSEHQKNVCIQTNVSVQEGSQINTGLTQGCCLSLVETKCAPFQKLIANHETNGSKTVGTGFSPFSCHDNGHCYSNEDLDEILDF